MTPDLKIGDRVIINTEEVDDDDGVERITPAGSTWEVLGLYPENDPDSTLWLGCPATGASGFFGPADVDLPQRQLAP